MKTELEIIEQLTKALKYIRTWSDDPDEPYGPGRRAYIDKVLKESVIAFGCEAEASKGKPRCMEYCGEEGCVKYP